MSGVSPSDRSHHSVYCLSDDGGAVLPQNGRKRAPVTPLDILAQVAIREKKQKVADEDPFDKCIKFIDIFCDTPPEIEDFFHSVCGDLLEDAEDFVEAGHLRKKFTLEEVVLINAVFEWLHVLNFGCLAGEEMDSFGLEAIKSFAGVSSLVELLSTSKTEGCSKRHLSLQGLVNLLGHHWGLEYPPKAPFPRFIYLIREIMQNLAAPDEILTTFKLPFHFTDENIRQKFLELFDGLAFEGRLRIALVINILAHWEDEPGQQSKILLELEKTLPQFPSELQPLIASIKTRADRCLKMPLWEGFAAKAEVLLRREFSEYSSFAKLDLPGLPNWMRNGGNSCYISSTVWGVFFLMDSMVQARLRQFDQVAGPTHLFAFQSPEMKEARAAFSGFYRKVAAPEAQCIERGEVNAFRLAVQSAFPEQFAPQTVVQEDACDFLVALVNEVLELHPRSQEAPRFTVLHTFNRATDEPLSEEEHYKYGEALAPSYSVQPSYILDVRLDEEVRAKTSLKELVTTSRTTETVERNAYKIGDFSGPKYLSFQAHHRELCLVDSRDSAPRFFIGRLTRFSWDFRTGVQRKRFDLVSPNATLEFHLRGREMEGDTVPYDLVAISVHSGDTIHEGHYYTYFRKQTAEGWRFIKYDDIEGVSICFDDKQAMRDASANGYIFYYKKREDGAPAPDPLPFEESEELQETVQRSESPFGKMEPVEGFLEGNDVNWIFDQPFSGSLIPQDDVRPDKAAFGEDGELMCSWAAELAAPAPLFEMALPSAILEPNEAKSWMETTRLANHFYLSGQDRFFRDLSELSLYFTNEIVSINSEQEGLQALCDFLKCPIYLIDLEKDRDLYVLDDQFPIPGDRFRIGEEFSGDPFYLFKQMNGSYVILRRKG